ncbi:MAG: HAMP domain-containing histidine kinase [Eubacterium sp.]|nr:HAMP domain-containing histidine kinase [Eubacterium sp.]
MKSVPKLIRRYVGIMLLSCVLLLVVNVVLLVVFTARQAPNAYPWKTAEEVADALQQTDDGRYALPEAVSLELKNSNTWAIFIDNETKQVIWQTANLPETIPLSYTVSDIASLTRGYIDGYPTFTGETDDGLIVLGYPKDSFWKHMWPSWDYKLIASLPQTALSVLAINAAIIFLIYVCTNSKLLKSIKPIVNGIQRLPMGDPVYIKEKGLLSELAMNINKASEILQSQNNQLRRKETARANWIAGVSHDIRTPLSMVMGYAGQLENDTNLSENERKKATAIRKQSERMRNLINDLNLASKLEYNMQPLVEKQENAVAIVRQVLVDFINTDIDNKFPIEWETDENISACFINADKELIKRAVSNLIQNCINHNENGCSIFVSVQTDKQDCIICIEDNGKGASDEQIEKLNNAPHYMVCDTNTTEQRHGLGLLIVKQVATSHNGTATIEHSSHGGFAVKITLPLLQEN